MNPYGRPRMIPAPIGYRGCTQCFRILPDREFYFDGRKVHSWCRECKVAHTRRLRQSRRAQAK